MRAPAPDFTLVLSLMLLVSFHLQKLLTVRVHAWTTACFDFGFDLHVHTPFLVRSTFSRSGP